MEGYKYKVQVELTPGDPVISAQVCLERKWGTQGNLNTNTATVTSLDVWSDIFFILNLEACQLLAVQPIVLVVCLTWAISYLWRWVI